MKSDLGRVGKRCQPKQPKNSNTLTAFSKQKGINGKGILTLWAFLPCNCPNNPVRRILLREQY